MLSSISFGSVIVVGIGVSMLDSPPPWCFFVGSLEKMALVCRSFLKHRAACLGHMLGHCAIYASPWSFVRVVFLDLYSFQSVRTPFWELLRSSDVALIESGRC